MRKGGVFYGMIFVVDGDQSKKLLAFSKMCLILSRATASHPTMAHDEGTADN